jgi:signal transduction histidine kinase/DNA-binding response OmpR family regulator
MVPVFLLTRKKDKSALILLISIGILFVGSVFFVLGLAYILPFEGLVKYGIQIGLLIFSAILFYGLFDKVNTIRGEKKRIEELDQLKSRFFANISHEFRTPLTLISGPIQQLIDDPDDTNDKHLLKTARRNADRLLALINQLLDLSKLEAGKMELSVQEQNFGALLKGITMSFESLAVRRHIRLHFASQQENISLFVDRDKIEKIFYNLLSNAFKFSEEQGEISVMLLDQKEEIEVLVRDNGKGIPADRLPHIFDRFYQVDSSETREQEGTGIGLALVKELVVLHQGNISVESKEGEGTTFRIHFLKGKGHFESHQLQEENEVIGDPTPAFSFPEFDQHESISPSLINNLPGQGNPENLPTVLIIEDNTDVRAYIKNHLVNSFHTLEAINGQDGIEKALEHLPDLIISDVMMPFKDGYEVCEILKTDPRSSHIPIILLTAKAAQEEKLKGLETGADDYLVKPFDTRELEVRVRNLIQLRQQLRQRFGESPRIDASAIGTNAVDKAFLEKVLSLIKEHLNDSQFSVEFLASEVGMSRVHLNRKLKALTDLSANKFIQAYRLEQALILLQEGAGNVSEIAFQTGFGSTAYFVKCFREKYGKTPGEVRK